VEYLKIFGPIVFIHRKKHKLTANNINNNRWVNMTHYGKPGLLCEIQSGGKASVKID